MRTNSERRSEGRSAGRWMRAIRIVLSTGSLLLLVLLSLGRQPALAVDPAANPHLARLEIDIWPEYDRPATLVILRAEIATSATLPAAASIRIPTAAGGPAAVASAPSANGRLVDLAYQRTDIGVDFTTLAFTATDRFFQVEFYDRLATDTPNRTYSYVWPGDFAVDEATLQLQQPATSTSLTVQPDLGAPIAGNDGLVYYEKTLGPLEGGKPFKLDVQYQKSNSQTSAELLGLTQQNPAAGGDSSSGGGVPVWVFILIGLGAVGVFGVAFTLWRLQTWPYSAPAETAPATRAERRRAGAARRTPTCRQCGHPLDPGDRFCPACGRAVRSRT